MRYRQGYWGIAPGQDVMMTPTAAQLLSELESGSRKPGLDLNVNAALVQGRDGGLSAPVAVSLPGNLVPFEKSKDQKKQHVSGIRMLLVARDSPGHIIALFEQYGDLRFDRREWDDFRQKTFNLQGHIPVPEVEGLSIQAIVEFSNRSVAMSARMPLEIDETANQVKLTSLLLSNHVESAECSQDTTEPLCIKNLRIYLPAQRRFAASQKLMVYLAALDLTPDRQTNLPALDVTFDLKSGATTKPIAPRRIQAVPGTAMNSLIVLAEFDLSDCKPGAYLLKANAEDIVRHGRGSRQMEFAVE